MEYWICFWCCKTHEGLWVLWRNWVMRSWEGWDGSVCRRTCGGLCSLCFNERHVAVVGIKLWMSPWVLCVWFLGEYAFSPLKWSRGKMGARCRERDYASDRHSQFWGDIKLCLCEVCWMHLIYIQLWFLARNP